MVKKNYSGVENPEQPPGITVFDGYNFSMPAPIDTAGVKTGWPLGWTGTLTFRDCNFVNREPPVGCTYDGTINTTIRESMVVTDTEDILYDGAKITELLSYADIIYGRFNVTTREYDYHAEPIYIEQEAPE